jgi:eukaryotic-like serine/threonine-protein kinase
MPTSPDLLWQRILETLRAATADDLIIGGELGRGGMAAVFLAYDTHLNRRVAIKVMAPELLLVDGLEERFSTEAATMANLRHPNIITVHSVRQVEDIRFFVMEFVAGRALDRVLQHAGRLTVSAVRTIAWEVGSALSYAHRRGVVHRDIKPANILLDEEGFIRVTDFGIAKVVEAPSRTRTGILMGTPEYMSPEQCYGVPVTPASDQYSLGVVLYELLVGTPPFSGSGFAVMQAHTLHPVPPLRTARADLPAPVEQAVLRMLEKEPERRWPTLRDALDALGAHALDDGDPVRSELVRLASVGEAPAATLQSLTPPDRKLQAPSSRPTPAISLGGAGVAATGSVSNGLEYLIVSDPPGSIEAGDAFTLSAMVCREGGTIVADRRVQWSSNRPEIATIDATSGAVRTLAPGAVIFTATANELSQNTPAEVRARPIATGASEPPAMAAPRIDVVRPGAARRRSIVLAASGLLGIAALVVVWASRFVAASPQRDSVVSGGESMVARDTAVAPPPVPYAPRREAPGTAAVPAPSRSPATPKRANTVARTAPAIATVDSTTRTVTAVTGPTVVAANSDSITKSVAVTVEKPAAAALAGAPSPAETTRTVAPPTTNAQVRTAAERCAAALQTRNVAQLTSLAQQAGDASSPDLQALLSLFREEGDRLQIGLATFGPRTDDESGASMEFRVQLFWRSSFGRSRNASLRLRSTVGKSATQGPMGCRIVESSGLH